MPEGSSDAAPIDQRIAQTVAVLRGHKVLLDTELAALYEVSTKRFNGQVRRNRERFPQDFMFQLTLEELASLRSQNATSNVPPQGRGGGAICPTLLLSTARSWLPPF